MMTTWEAIFPTPVLRSNIGREFTEKELAFFRQAQDSTYPNLENKRSANTQVLDAPELRPLRSIIDEHVQQFARKVVTTNAKLKFYVTQSWINYTQPGQSHHKHFHTNSLISGVLYVNALKEMDKLYFYRTPPAGISVGNKEQNWYTSDSWFFAVGTGDLILFPSSITHGVEQVTGNYVRVSLSFNTFVAGEIGDKESLNSLKLGS